MKNITLIALTFIITLLISSCANTYTKKQETPSAVQELDYVVKSLNINTTTTTIESKGVMIGTYSQTGFVSIKQRNLVWQASSIASGSITIDMLTMSQCDNLYKTEENKLVAHLESPDFFDIANFPTATFEITSSDVNTNTVYGNLTLRGITENEVLENVVFDGETK